MANLPADVAKEFDCDTVTKIITKAPHRESIDLSKISLAKARELSAKGLLPMLKPKAKAEKASEKESDKKS